MRLPLAIIGNGAAAAEAVLALRAQGREGDIHLFADNEHAPYNPMLGTYLVSGAIPLERAFPFGDERRFYGINRVTAHLGETVVRLDAAEQTLTTTEGSTHRYDRCLVASGARPSVPPIPGLREALAPRPPEAGSANAWAAAEGSPGRRVFTLRTLNDALSLKEAVDTLRWRSARPISGPRGARSTGSDAPRVAVIGASLAGVKIAAVLRGMGLKVCLVEREPSILPLSAHRECARLMETHLLEEGYELRLGAALAGVEIGASGVRLDFGALPGAADPGGAGGTACEDGAPQEDVDLVVVCTGSRPSLSFLAPGQVDVGAGILVDERMRSTIPTLYAAGDVAQGKNPLTGRHEIIGLWSNARYQGRAAGRSLAGAPGGYRGSVPHNITHVGRMIFASIGCLDEYDRIATRAEGGSFQVRVWLDGCLVGVNLLNCCLSSGTIRQALLRVAGGAGTETETEATWTSFSE
jgi:NADPH-dependent 2,4-dienoyl-CoA reductase/sulfur reductase-like enzyme